MSEPLNIEKLPFRVTPVQLEIIKLAVENKEKIKAKDPHPILKNKSIYGKDFTKEETRPKSILKKKTHSEDSSSMNKVKPILKKNKSSEDFQHNISSSSSSSSSSSLSNTSISSLPRSSLRRNSDSP